MLNTKKLLTKILQRLKDLGAETGSSGAWSWKKYSDGTFEATATFTNGSMGNVTAFGTNAGCFSQSLFTATLPAAIGCDGITFAKVTANHSNNMLLAPIYSIGADYFTWRYLKIASTTTISSGIRYSYLVKGTWS